MTSYDLFRARSGRPWSEALFAKYDVDGDGLLSPEEITSVVMSGVSQGNRAGPSHMYLSNILVAPKLAY
jgi:hypothetical protein